MDTLLVIILGWIVLSIPVSLLIGRFLAGNRKAVEAAAPQTSIAHPETQVTTVTQRSESQLETPFGDMLQVSKS
jgi:hypothetical protein